jgi:large subunit ribosomal protein L21
MYAIIETGGKQYTIKQGDKVRVEKLSGNTGDDITIGTVLAINDGEHMVTGSPYVTGASVVGKVLAQAKADKVTVFKYKRRKDTKKKKGHRQLYTEFLVEKIDLQGQVVRGNLSSEHGEREGKAPAALPQEGATRAPEIETGASNGS